MVTWVAVVTPARLGTSVAGRAGCSTGSLVGRSFVVAMLVLKPRVTTLCMTTTCGCRPGSRGFGCVSTVPSGDGGSVRHGRIGASESDGGKLQRGTTFGGSALQLRLVSAGSSEGARLRGRCHGTHETRRRAPTRAKFKRSPRRSGERGRCAAGIFRLDSFGSRAGANSGGLHGREQTFRIVPRLTTGKQWPRERCGSPKVVISKDDNPMGVSGMKKGREASGRVSR
jgi:hypothetical protein